MLAKNDDASSRQPRGSLMDQSRGMFSCTKLGSGHESWVSVRKYHEPCCRQVCEAGRPCKNPGMLVFSFRINTCNSWICEEIIYFTACMRSHLTHEKSKISRPKSQVGHMDRTWGLALRMAEGGSKPTGSGDTDWKTDKVGPKPFHEFTRAEKSWDLGP